MGSSIGAKTPALTSLSSSCYTEFFNSIHSHFEGRKIGSASDFHVSHTNPGKVPTSPLKMSRSRIRVSDEVITPHFQTSHS